MARQSPSELAREVKGELDAFRAEFAVVRAEVERANLPQLETQVGELKRTKEESDRRHWQFVYIALGCVFTIFAQLLVNLLLPTLKK